MKLKMLSFIGYILVLSFHCATSQPLEALDLPTMPNLAFAKLRDGYPTYLMLNSLQESNTVGKNDKKRNNTDLPKLPSGYTEFSKRNGIITAYKFHRTKKAWNEARNSCHQEGGYLAYPESVKEGRKYHHILKRVKSGGAWMGMHDLFEEGDWVTVLGEKVNDLEYVNWASTEPNNYGIDGENCAELQLDGMLYDMSCDKKLFYFCKIRIRY